MSATEFGYLNRGEYAELTNGFVDKEYFLSN